MCVKCGMCLPHCPTYRHALDEGDSPRGRIALMQGLVNKRIGISQRLEFHIDRCLACRACETACPSNVPYGQLIIATRALLNKQRKRDGKKLHGMADQIIAHKTLLRAGATLLRLYQISGLGRLILRSGIPWLSRRAIRLERILPDIPVVHRLKRYYPPAGIMRGKVALFTGCIGSIFDRRSLHAACNVLTRCGYGVHVPDRQVCCGALHLHQGDAEKAARFAIKNLAVFGALNVDAVVFTTSGCGALLNEYPLMNELLETPLAGLRQFRIPVMDISQFLTRIAWPPEFTLMPLGKRVVVHEPCSLRHVLHQEGKVYELLNHIPEVDISAYAGNGLCCGAAGSYMLTQPDMADTLRTEHVREIKKTHADILVTSNIGCALHLNSGVREAGLPLEVIHPIVLLDRQTRC